MLMPLVVCGQTDTTTVTLDQVVVTATLHAVQRSQAPAIVDIVGSKQLQATSSVDLAEGLQLGTGLRVEYTCQNCGANDLRINGLGGQYTQVLLDGHPISGSLAGVYLLEQLPAALIDRVEVMRGGGSSLYGAGAIAGVVNVITREPLRNSASVGGTARLVGGRSMDWNTRFDASVLTDNRRAGLSLFGSNRHRSPYDRDGDGFSELGLLRSQAIGFRGFVRTGDYGKLSAEYHKVYEYRRGGDRFDLPAPLSHISEGGDHHIDAGSLKWDLLPADGRSQLSLYAAAQNVDRQGYYGQRDEGDPIGTSYGFTVGLNTCEGVRYSRNVGRLLFMPATLTGGLEHSYDHLTDRNLNSPDTVVQSLHMGSAYLQSEWENYRWTIVAGLRADKHSAVRGAVVSPRLNVRFAPTERVALRAGYSAGFRAPQIFDEDLHVAVVQGELFKVSNVDGLKMERSHSLTASADVCFDLLGADVDLLVEGFYTSIGNAFAVVWVGDDTVGGYRLYERRNADGARVVGVNAELGIKPSSAIDFKAGATLQRGRYTGAGIEYADGRFEHRIERSPDFYGHLTLSCQPLPMLNVSLNGVFTGPMLVYHAVGDDVQRKITPSFFDLALRVGYDIALSGRTKLNLQGGVLNLLDAYQKDLDQGPGRDATYIYGPTMPRTVYLGATLSL